LTDKFTIPPPPRRRLKIYAFDPMLGRHASNRIVVDIPNYEPLHPGPRDSRIEVIDFDAPNGVYYPAVDLDDVHLAMNDGLDPSDSDPRFHQQMTYAVARRVLENFDVALGRRISFRDRPRLRFFPHALPVANAFYDPKMTAVLFGYFRTAKDNAEAGIPGQTIFTCLSHDIIAHETTHALVHRLRRRFMEPTNADVAGFHEGFSDIIAILQHFSFPGILRQIIQRRQRCVASRKWQARDVEQQRLIGRVEDAARARRHRAHRIAMIGVAERDELRAFRLAAISPVLNRHLKCDFHRS